MVKNIGNLQTQEILTFRPAGETVKTIYSSFFRGDNCNFNPYGEDFLAPDFLQKFLLKGCLPDQPMITSTTNVTALGSCFAANIAARLDSLGFTTSKKRNPEIYISRMAEGLVNVHAIVQQFEWALENLAPPENLWYGFDRQEYGYDETIRLQTRKAFLETEFFIITLGLSEVWYDELSGGVFWRAIPQSKYDPTRHKFRVCSFGETKEQINRIYDLILKHVPGAKVLFSVSPIPLVATFRPMSCLTANSASKAILRAALDETFRERADSFNKTLFYFPSYELISDLFYVKFRSDGRHPNSEIIQVAMELFETVYCNTGRLLGDVGRSYQEARKKNGERAPIINFSSPPQPVLDQTANEQNQGDYDV